MKNLRRKTMPKTIRSAVVERAGGYCDFCGGEMRDSQAEVHHRKLRIRGGEDTIENLVAVHPSCHQWIHAHPEKSGRKGFMVHSWEDPALMPVLLHQKWPCMPENTWRVRQ